jgi:hypothetical protein
MVNKLKTIGKILIAVTVMVNTVMPAHASLVFTNDVFQNEASIFRVGQGYDADATGSTLKLEFGTTNTKTFMWDQANSAFSFSNNVNFNSNQMLQARIENATGANSLPGGAGGLGIGSRGRIVQLTGIDTVAPGCTLSPNCGSGTYVWDGSTWISLTGSTSSNFNKLITVGSTGSDYTTIAAGAAYLQTLSGGIILLSAETHNITTAVNMTNIIMIGKDASRTTVNITGAGQLDSYDTTYEYLTIETGTITDDMAIDVQTGSNALLFNYVDIDIQDTGDSLIDSNAGTAPTVSLKFVKSNMTGGDGTILKTKALSNLNTSSAIYVDSRSSDTPLQMSDWNLTLAGGGSVNTSGIISPIPADSIIVSPNMNLQGAIDSLEYVGNGGLITLLPGIYDISQPLTIEDDGIEMVGYGDSSIINASGFTGGSTIAAIQVGAANGTAAKSNVVLKDFKLQVSGTGASDIHGIRITGGADNRIDNVTVQKISGTSGSAGTAHMGIQMTDAASGCTGTCVLTRPVIYKSRVLGTSGATAYFTDGIHMTSVSTGYSGVFGYDQGINNALVDGNSVDYVAETAYVFVGADSSSLFNNRASRMGASGGGAYGIFMGKVTDANMNANVFTCSLTTSGIAIGIEPFNVTNSTVDSIFNSNVIDGGGAGCLGFGTGFQVGNAANTQVHRNSFQSNSIHGAATAGGTIAFDLRGNADDNTISNNDIDGSTASPNGWDTGINIAAAAAQRNHLIDNRFSNTTALISDSGSYTQFGTNNHRAAANPTVNDDNTLGYRIGAIWVNTAANTSYVLVNDATGAAVWQAVGGAGSHTQNTDTGTTSLSFTVNNTSGAGNPNVTFGSTLGSKIMSYDVANTRFNLNDNLNVAGSVTATATQTKYQFLDIAGGVNNSVTVGTLAGGRSPVLQYDAAGASDTEWSFPVPDDWVAGTPINVVVYWTPSNNNALNVRWNFDYASLATGENVVAGSFALISYTQAAPGSANPQIVSTGTNFQIPGAAMAANDMVNIRLQRDGANGLDTFTGNVNIQMVRIEYTGKKIL